jgi:hypothetical protein
MQLVVSRYNENVDWTKDLKNVIIYNKGDPLGFKNEIPLKNVGREGHTYYYHIYENYDNLDDYVIFLQGNPFDHSPNILKNLLEYTKRDVPLKLAFEFLSEEVINTDIISCTNHRTIHHENGLPMEEVYTNLFGKLKANLEIQFGAGAQFIVSKELILKKEKLFYKRIMDMLSYDINPIEGFIIERYHKLIFTKDE